MVDFQLGRRRDGAVIPLPFRKVRDEWTGVEDGSNAWACHRGPPCIDGWDSEYGLLSRRTMAADISIMLHFGLFITLLLLVLLLLYSSRSHAP